MFIDALKGIALFGLLGPVIGLLTVVLLAMASTSDWSFNSLALLIPAAYFIGGVPAVVCGLLAGLIRARLHGVTGCLAAGVGGAVCSASYYLLMSIHGNSDYPVIALFAVAGFIAGIVCGIIFLTLPNNSFKPKPLRGSA